MKGNIIGNKKAQTEPHAIRDPVSNDLLVANEYIKKATLKYCVNNLVKDASNNEEEPLLNIKKALIEKKIHDALNEPLEISRGDFGFVVILLI